MAIFKKRVKPTQLEDLAQLELMLESGRPILLDFFQFGCGPCKVMDGIVNELADEFGESARVVKVNVARVPGAAELFRIRSTPTFVVIGGRDKVSKNRSTALAARWRTSGLVKKDQLQRALTRAGAAPSSEAQRR